MIKNVVSEYFDGPKYYFVLVYVSPVRVVPINKGAVL